MALHGQAASEAAADEDVSEQMSGQLLEDVAQMVMVPGVCLSAGGRVVPHPAAQPSVSR